MVHTHRNNLSVFSRYRSSPGLFVILGITLGGLLDSDIDWGVIWAYTLCVSVVAFLFLLKNYRKHRASPLRTIIVGSKGSATALTSELQLNHVHSHNIIGYVKPGDETSSIENALGNESNITTVIERHRVDLVVLAPEASRAYLLKEILAQNFHQKVQVCDLPSFYEDLFGSIPIAQIKADWFQEMLHPNYRSTSGWEKRAFDIALSMAIGIFCLPVLAICILLVKLDGGPALFKQLRSGQFGKPFTIYKLRTMVVDSGDPRKLASDADRRVTPVGRVLRKLHLDEMPQLYNILKGDMSIVGPRPEQFALVSHFEDFIPYYKTRALAKPGLAGLAQLRCGYAGSDEGTAWKLCYDLYYLKHQSFRLDLAIIFETLLYVAANKKQFIELHDTPFVSTKSGTTTPLMADK